MQARRLSRLARTQVLGRDVAVAEGLCARLLGLALLTRSRAGSGLAIPRCRSVHTFGMRFAVDLCFLDEEGQLMRAHRAVGPGRVLGCRGASTVLELPATPGGLPPTRGESAAGYPAPRPEKENEMSLIDKLTGRAKKAAGDLTGDGSLRREGHKEEKKGEAKEDLNRAQDNVEEKADEVSDLERKT